MAITEKKGKFYCRFQLNGERHHYLCNGASNKTEALKIENAFKYKLQQIQNGVISKENKQSIQLKELYSLFLNYSKNNKKSYDRDISYIRVLKTYFYESLEVNNIKPKDIEAFKEHLKTNKNNQNSTVNKYLNTMKKMFNLAIANKLINHNPFNDVKNLKEPNYKVRYLTPDEESRLFDVIDSGYQHIKPIIVCALHTGMRKSEILNLKWCNVDMEYRFIELLETKSGKSRRIPISDTLYQTFNQLPQTSPYVFINNQTNQPYTDIHKSWHAILKKANIKDFRFHDLRHTVATRLTECNIDLVVVKELLGHSKIETTMRYAHAVPKRKIEAIEILNSYNDNQQHTKNYQLMDNQKSKNGHRMDTAILCC